MANTSTVKTRRFFDSPWLRRLLHGPDTGPRTGIKPIEGAPAAGPRCLNLALQGGGAHGAFTWGVLDALLDDPELKVDGVSGSSAGAMNAVLFADGWMKGGREGARQSLTSFWTEIGKQMPMGWVAHHQGDQVQLSSLGKMLYQWTGVFSPSQINPFDLNPLRDLLISQVDFERLRHHSPFKLFVCATQVSTGKMRIFREHELTVDVMLASACLPRIHHPVRIDGETYWDGGFSANPPVAPLFYECDASDLLLVLLNPLVRQGVPATTSEIQARTTELAFTASFMAEMRVLLQAITSSSSATASDGPDRFAKRLQQCRFHMIDTSHLPAFQHSDTKLLAYGPFLTWLRDLGREQAVEWLNGPSAAVGRHSSIDVQALFA